MARRQLRSQGRGNRDVNQQELASLHYQEGSRPRDIKATRLSKMNNALYFLMISKAVDKEVPVSDQDKALQGSGLTQQLPRTSLQEIKGSVLML